MSKAKGLELTINPTHPCSEERFRVCCRAPFILFHLESSRQRGLAQERDSPDTNFRIMSRCFISKVDGGIRIVCDVGCGSWHPPASLKSPSAYQPRNVAFSYKPRFLIRPLKRGTFGDGATFAPFF